MGGAPALQAWVSVLGHDVPHAGYEFRIAVADAQGSLPDAWRFDTGGCQDPSRIRIETIPPSEQQICQAFQDWGPYERSYSLATPDLGLPATAAVIRLAITYPEPNSTRIDPTRRYYLGTVTFDHSNSVVGSATEPGTCGGLERGMCLTLLPAHVSYMRTDGTRVPFSIGNGTITLNGGDCAAVPAGPSTWGTIKAQYRR